MNRLILALVLAALASTSCAEERTVLRTVPEEPPGPPGIRPPIWRQLAAGNFHTCVLVDGEPWCWGRNEGGTLGETEEPILATPNRVASPVPLVAVAAGEGFTCGLTAQGAVWCWGNNDYGQLGTGDFESRSIPTLVPLPEAVRRIDTGYFHACAITVSRALYCWGRNDERQLGIGGVPGAPPEPSPRRVGTASDWSHVATGGGHTCGLRDGSLWCWGRNLGAVGVDPEIDLQPPEPVIAAPFDDWVSISCGQHDTCGLRADGALWCMGANSFGVHATGDKESRFVPARAEGLPPAIDVLVNNFNGCALTSDGDVLCWGWNELGALGQGDTVERLEPALLPPPGGYVEMSLGFQHNCARRYDGSVWCVGRNVEGQLGDGTTQSRAELTPIAFP